MKNLIKIWKNKGAIIEGVRNSIFKSEHIEEIAQERYSICNRCPFIDRTGEHCAVRSNNTECCKECGCMLKFKTRSLSSQCPKGYWDAEVSEEEEDLIIDNLKE